MTYDDKSLSGADDARLPVTGAGGMGGKGGSSASTAPDTLFSTATVRLIDLLGEGEIRGVRGGLKGVYLNDVPVQNADGSFNFKGLTAEFRVGTPDQTYMAGYPDVQTPKDVGIKVNQATPVVVSISDTDVDRLRVTVQIPSLFLAKTDGAVKANTLNYRIEARYSGGPWVNSLGDLSLTGKTTSGYYRSHEIPLPRNPSGASAPWQVRVTRLTPDTDGYNNSQSKYTSQSDLIFASTTSIVDAKFSYPHSAMVGLTAQASSFGSSVPSRTYLVDGVLMPIPSNYDPATRAYAGIWDGTFKEGFTNNPAWALYLILRDDRFGLGEFIDVQAIDKWTLYDIARYCDTLVDDGKGGKEPRYTFNGSISSQQQAFELIQLIAQIFRGTVYWSSGSVTASQDRPGDPVLLVTEANVLDDSGFSYASSGRRARHTVALVAWNDPDNLYKQAIEVVEDADGVARYGYNPTRIDLLGCTSRGQAHRAGLWTLFTELHQTQVVTYKAGLDHAVARPGDVVAIQDPQIANLDLSGRLKAGSTTTELILDRNVDLTLASGYSVSVTLPDGKVEERAVTNGIGPTGVVRLGTALSQTPDPAAVWLIAGPVEPQLFRIVSIHEEEPHVYAVSALQHEPGKYAAIDSGAAFEPTVISQFPTIVLPPKDLTVRESQYTERGQAKQGLTLSWTAGQPFNAVAHYVTVVRPSGAVVTSRTPSTSIDFLDAEAGEWKFTVVTQGLNGKSSLPTERTYTVVGWAGQAPTTVTGLSVKGGGDTFSGRSCTLTWTNKRADNVPPYPIRNVVYVFDASSAALLHREMLPVGQTEWTYDYQVNLNEGGPRRRFRVSVCALSVDEAEGPLASLLVSNPAPAIIVPTLSSTSETLFVELPKVTDPDFAGYLVWVSETAGINPVTAKSFEVQNNLFTFAGTPDKTYYVRAAAYDAFSKNPAELNVSIEQSKAITILLFDPTAPARPAAPTLVSTAETGIDGTLTSSVKATWPAVTSANLAYYEIAWQIASGDWQIRRVDTNAATERGFQPATVVNAKVRSVSKMGFVSSYGPVGTVTTNKNTVRPANPTNPSVSGKFQRITVTFTPPADKDLDYIEVWATDSISSAPTPPMWATMVGRIPYGQAAYWDDMPTMGQRTYWLRSHNTSDLVAATYLLAGNAQTAALESAQLAAGIIDATKMAAGLEVPRVFESLPAAKTGQFVTLRSDGRLYHWDEAQGKYVAESFDVADIKGLTADQIAGVKAAVISGQIVASQIANAAITLGKFADGLQPIVDVSALPNPSGYTGPKVVRLTTDGKLYRLVGGAWTAAVPAADITGQIVATQITDKAITTGKIAANAITANELSAGAVTADTIAAGAISGDKIAANAISARKLMLGATSANLLPVGEFQERLGGWNRAESSQYQIAGIGPTGTPFLRLDRGSPTGASVNISTLDTELMPVPAGTTLAISLWVRPAAATATTGMRVRFNWYDNNKVALDPSITDAFGGSTAAPAGWSQIAKQITTPANAAFMRFTLWHANDGNTQYLDFASIAIRRTTGVTLIEDGAITTDKVAANAIVAGKIAAGAVTADTVAANAITASKLYLTDMSNMLKNGDFGGSGAASGESWTIPTNAQTYIDTVGPDDIGGYHLLRSNFRDQAVSHTIACTVGDEFYLSAMVNQHHSSVAQILVRFTDARGTEKSLPSAAATNVKNSWVRLEGRVKAPPGATQFHVILQNERPDGGSGELCYWGRAQCRRAANAQMIVDGTITADKIVANSITAAQIQAGAIGADQIAAGAITTSKLAVNGANLAFNPDLSQGTRGWGRWNGWNGVDAAALSAVTLDANWNPSGFKSVYVQYNKPLSQTTSNQAFGLNAHTVNADGNGARYRLTAGVTYEVSCFMSLHRCQGRIYIDTRGPNGEFTGNFQANLNGGGGIGGTTAEYPRAKLIFKVPPNTDSMDLYFMAHTINGDNPYIFVSGLMIATTRESAVETSPYVPPSQTIIDGGNIFAGSLTARAIAAGTITTDLLEAGKINVDTIAANGTISANKLKADVLTVGNITITGRTTLSSWATGTQINGGAIAANTISAERLDIRSRGVQAINLSFEANKATRTVSWNAGHILYINDTGGYGQNDPVAGSVSFPGGYGWIYWIKGEDRLIGTTDPAPYMANPNAVQMANYDGAAGLNVINGGVIIDGTRISAGTITAGQIAANSIQTVHLAANSINGDRITAGTLAADKIAAGTITAGVIQVGTQGGQGLLVMEAFGIRPGRLYCRDLNSTLRGMFGYIGDFTGIANDFGLLMWNAEGKQILTTSGLGAGTVGDVQVSSLSASKINADSLSALSANLGTVTAGVARSADGKFVIDFNNKFIEMFD